MASIVAVSPSIKLKVTLVRGEFGGRGKRVRGRVLRFIGVQLCFVLYFRFSYLRDVQPDNYNMSSVCSTYLLKIHHIRDSQSPYLLLLSELVSLYFKIF